MDTVNAGVIVDNSNEGVIAVTVLFNLDVVIATARVAVTIVNVNLGIVCQRRCSRSYF